MDDVNQYSVIIVLATFVGAFIGAGVCWLLIRGQLSRETAVASEKFHAKSREYDGVLERVQQYVQTVEKLEIKNENWQQKYGEEVDRRATAEEKNTRLPNLEECIQNKDLLLQERQNQIAQQQSQTTELKTQVAELSVQLENERKSTEEKLALLMESKSQLKEEFNNLANKIFEEKGSKFASQNKQSLEALLTPFREQMTDFKKRVEVVYDNESRDRAVLQKEISLLKDLNVRISEDAINLTKALKGENKTQGNWGEMILERVLEESGLQKGREYQTQGSFTSDEGKRLKPDVIIHLPEGKDVVVDSKVSLVAYEAYSSAESNDVAKNALTAHVQSIRNHVMGLSGKDYASLEGVRSLDFVLMFIPIEASFLIAMEDDPSLFSYAFGKNIIIVCPSTLLVTLRTIQNAWRNEYQNQNALEIAKKAGALYDRFVLFTESLMDIGEKLDKAQSAYGTAMKRISSGRGNLVQSSQELQKLGAKTKKKMADSLIAASDDDASDPEKEQVESSLDLLGLETNEKSEIVD